MKFFRDNWKTILVGFICLFCIFSYEAYDLYKENHNAISYTKFVKMVDSEQVKKVTITNFAHVEGYTKKGERFTTTVSPDDKEINNKLMKSKVDVTNKIVKNWQNAMSMIINIVFLLVFVGYIFYAKNIGRMEKKEFDKETGEKVTFADVAGCAEAKQELEEVVDFLTNPERFTKVGARVPKGVLLAGPPGTGKTLLAKAVAGEADVHFYSLSGSDFVEVFAGVGAARFRSLFKEAKENAPCIIFIDEIDSIGYKRGEPMGGADSEREQALNQLLVGMDGFEASDGIIVLAGTNRPDVLDPALLRSGRFDRKIILEKPDLKSRLAILAIHAKERPFSEDMDWNLIARRTAGFTGADLANLLNEAAIVAGRKDQEQIFMCDVEECIDKVSIGVERKNSLISDGEKQIIAYHEGGHALVAKLLGKKVEKISVIPRGQALGYVLQNNEEEKRLLQKDELLDQIAICLAGRASERRKFGAEKISNGASNDIQVANSMAQQAVCNYGMSDVLPDFYLDYDFRNRRSEHYLHLADDEVAKMIEEGRKKAERLLEENQDKLEKLVEVLLEKETLLETDLEELGIFEKAKIDSEEIAEEA